MVSKFSRPTSFEVRITDGDISSGYHYVYDAEEMDKWLDLLKNYLLSVAYEPMVAQYGNVAQRLLNIFFKSKKAKGV